MWTSACCRPRAWPPWRPHRGVPAAVISASHNPFADNGIKLFAAGGCKLADDVEERLEAELAGLLGAARPGGPGRSGRAGTGRGGHRTTWRRP